MRHLLAFTALALLAACAVPAPGPTPTGASATARPSDTATPDPTHTPTLAVSPTRPPCLGQPGQIVEAELEDPALPRSLPYRVYLPACYAALPQARFPALYLLHGLAATDSQWDALGADEAAEALIAAGAAPPFLIVMPWERKGLEYESAIVDFLVPAIDATYHTRADREGRALGGISRGAGWALRIGIRHPDLFSALGLHSPAVIVPDLYYLPGWLQAVPAGQMPRLWIDIGDHDVLLASARELTAVLDDTQVPYAWHLFTGYHEPAYWSAHVEEYLRWYSAGW
jgi:enterochelin esterase-like enzyme